MERDDEGTRLLPPAEENENTQISPTQMSQTGDETILVLVPMSDEERESEEGEERRDETAKTTTVLPEGEPFEDSNHFAVLALVDIAEEVKKVRKVPQLLRIKYPVTVIGTGRDANFKVDDMQTVLGEHSAIVFRTNRFHLIPIEGEVKIGDRVVPENGMILVNGTRFEMGSAKFLFLCHHEEE